MDLYIIVSRNVSYYSADCSRGRRRDIITPVINVSSLNYL